MIIESIIHRNPIDKGWSGDRKYCAETADGTRYLLRISPADLYERRKQEYLRMLKIARLDIPMCLPVEFGTSEDGVYTLHSWIDGSDAEAVIPGLRVQEQYAYGITAGQILARLHGISAPEGQLDWESYFRNKTERKIERYLSCGLFYDNGDCMVRYLREHMNLLKNRPVSYQHGDYHIGNMMIDRSGRLSIIDFEKDSFGDPYEEFNRIVWSAQAAPEFARGIVDGYFDSNVPEEFWGLLAFYVCSNSIGSLPWAVSYGEQEVKTMIRQAADILNWYDNMTNIVPSWYRKDTQC